MLMSQRRRRPAVVDTAVNIDEGVSEFCAWMKCLAAGFNLMSLAGPSMGQSCCCGLFVN